MIRNKQECYIEAIPKQNENCLRDDTSIPGIKTNGCDKFDMDCTQRKLKIFFAEYLYLHLH